MPAERAALFVTGTDTGVGKTVVTAAIAALAAAAGRRVFVYKPAQTGVSDDEPGDLDFVRVLPGKDGGSTLLRTACAYRLREPLAPAVAARLEGVAIQREVLIETYRDAADGADVALAEGAGGLLVPVAPGYTMADLACDLGLPLLVVARSGLGTLNHTALTVEAARRRGINVAGIVISGFPRDPDVAARTNPAMMVEMTGAPLLGVLPHVEGLDAERLQIEGLTIAARDGLAPVLGGTFDAGRFLSGLVKSSK